MRIARAVDKGLGLRFQRKNRDGRVSAADLGRHLVVIAAYESRDHRDVLFAAQGVTHHAARDWTTYIVPVENLAVVGIEYKQVSGDLAGEDHVAASDRYAADHRFAGLISPARRASGSVKRGQPAPRAGQRVELELAAEELASVLLALWVRRLRCRSELVAPIGRRQEQCVEPGAVGGAVPLVTAKEARTHVRERRSDRAFRVLARGERSAVVHIARVAIQHPQPPLYSLKQTAMSVKYQKRTLEHRLDHLVGGTSRRS